jgi:hypothetical protein
MLRSPTLKGGSGKTACEIAETQTQMPEVELCGSADRFWLLLTTAVVRAGGTPAVRTPRAGRDLAFRWVNTGFRV